MTSSFAELDRDMGMELEGILSPYSVVRLGRFFLANKFLAKRKQPILQLPVRGDLFGSTIVKTEALGVSQFMRTKLNMDLAMGSIILDNIDDEAALRLTGDMKADARMNVDMCERQSETLDIRANGRLIFDRLKVEREYVNDIDSLKLNDVSISTTLRPDNQVFFLAGIEFRF